MNKARARILRSHWRNPVRRGEVPAIFRCPLADHFRSVLGTFRALAAELGRRQRREPHAHPLHNVGIFPRDIVPLPWIVDDVIEARRLDAAGDFGRVPGGDLGVQRATPVAITWFRFRVRVSLGIGLG